MTDLIDSLLEFSRTRESLRPTYGNVKETLERVIQSIRTRPEYHLLQINVSSVGNSTGWFDSRKLERVFYNLLLNGCEAVAADRGHIDIELQEIRDGVTIRVSDNGHGIPEAIRGRLFEPFVSYGKENGTGLGLTVVHKIVQDHGGNVTVEKTSDEGTVFKLVLPLTSSPNGTPESRGEHRPVPPPLARTKNSQSE
jgi:signal transduction histidine kinase